MTRDQIQKKINKNKNYVYEEFRQDLAKYHSIDPKIEYLVWNLADNYAGDGGCFKLADKYAEIAGIIDIINALHTVQEIICAKIIYYS